MKGQEINVHIPYHLKLKAYHIVIARLVSKYVDAEGRVLDVGCGTGLTLKLIRDTSPKTRLYGADIDPTCLSITDQRVQLDKKLQINDVSDLFKMNHEKYDAIVMSHVLEHVHRPYDTVQGLMDLLKPGGYLFLAVPNPVTPKVIISNLLRRYKENKGHVQTWDQAHWRNFLEVILELNVVEYPVDFMNLPYLERHAVFRPLLMRLAKIFPGFSRSCMAVIKKG